MNESAERYIKTIYALKRENGSVRSVDVANELGFSRASVSIAIAKLRKNSIVIVNQNGEIDFTEQGVRLAGEIYERHITLRGFLRLVAGVDEGTAKEDAGRIEHHISEKTYNGIKSFILKHPELKPA